jgi:cytochrome P450
VIATCLGVPGSDLDDFHRWSDGVVAGFHAGGHHPGAPLRSILAVLALHRHLGKTFGRLREQPGDDVISTLLAARSGGSVSDQELFWLSLMLLVAGNETTTNLIGSLLLALASAPQTYQRLRAAPELIDAAIEEAVRWGSPIQYLCRSAAADYAVRDTVIPAGSRVLLLFGAANRDPRKFRWPDTFDIDRNPTDHLGFGGGIHYCLGARLARLEARVVLEELLSRVGKIRVAGPVGWTRNPTVRGPRRLFLELEA